MKDVITAEFCAGAWDVVTTYCWAYNLTCICPATGLEAGLQAQMGNY